MIQYILLFILGKISYDQFFMFGDSKWLYLLSLTFLIFAIWYEMASSGCTLSNCSHEHNKKAFDTKDESKADVLCKESRRVKWRITYATAFIIFTILNIVRLEPKENLVMLLVSWFVIQNVFGFFDYHKFGVWCN